MSRLLKILFFALCVRPLVLFVLGLNIRNRLGLPEKGPAIISANHNSHLDTLVLMSLFKLKDLHRVRPVAAADYFCRNKIISWFSLNIIGIIPLDRKAKPKLNEMFKDCEAALNQGDILLIFPEGSRGKPEQFGKIKKGLFYLTKEAQCPVYPVVMHGLGRALPRGEALFVPFNCDIIIGEALAPQENSDQFVEQLGSVFQELLSFCLTRENSSSSRD